MNRPPPSACPRCGYAPLATRLSERRKKCPACHLPLPQPEPVRTRRPGVAGHVGGLDQLVYLVVLFIFVIILLRILGARV